MSKKTLYIHIGSGKTGTTAIQRFAFANKAVLRKKGLHVVSSERKHHGPLCENLIAGDKRPLFAVAKEVQDSRAPKFLISYERLCELNEDKLGELLDALKTFDLKIIYYVRRRSDSLRSSFAQALKLQKGERGNGVCRQLFEGRYPDKFDHLDYLGIVRRWQRGLTEIGQPNAFDMRVFEASCLMGGNVVLDFYSRMGVVGPDEDLDKAPYANSPEIVNPSISPSGQYLMGVLYLVGLDDRQRAIVRDLLCAIEAPEDKKHSLIPDEIASALDERFARDDAILAREFFGRNKLFLEEAKFTYLPPDDDSFLRIFHGLYAHKGALAALRHRRHQMTTEHSGGVR